MRFKHSFAIALLTIATSVSGQVDESELSLQVERAFPSLRLRRPVVIANAGDGSNRIFFVTQQGVIHVIPNDPAVEQTTTFLDIESRVVYQDKENEEGMLGLAFHPDYERNGEFFVYYTTTAAPHTSVVSRFRVSKDNPNQADPNFEEELLRVEQPYWNHNGGSLAFGPDGCLYISLGDGGSANDPHGNGQNLETLLGSILRINVDRRDEGKNYSIPQDNPFVRHERARSEIWAFGLRNVWGMSFDRETGQLWAADVGQNIWEEINLITRGGNYGWNLREAKHKFGENGAEPRDDLIDPIWEYHHDIGKSGKSITGGSVYRGKKLPSLVGAYLYADYLSGRLWALRYDDAQKKVVANHSIPTKTMPIVAFGEDEQGEIYFADAFGFIYQLGPLAK
ncbi:MAG: PQQ-dependent sugar dehydrogenase [Planctomycetia bacterium]|nr:PQQ-dependent sugar dehydrogenase [Planctomycetia bacterium]